MSAVAYTETASDKASTRPIALWLFICAGMVFAMAVIGAITRLTESGLSMVEWRPFIGALPPLDEAEWNRVFGLYQQTPEFRLKNFGMDLAQFKQIFFWEWFHRLWGQLIGIVFAVPFLWFSLRRCVPAGIMPKLIGLLVLGGLQGIMGWYMVKSGLVDRPDVSHYRLAAHLMFAVVIFSALLWVALDVIGLSSPPVQVQKARELRAHTVLALGLAVITIVWGAFVAGLDAGFAYNTFPLMNGDFAPPEMWNLEPVWLNPLENTATVQFIHRWLAITTAAVVLVLSWRARRSNLPKALRVRAVAVGHMALLQVALGISTLLLVVPIPLAAAHQAGAFVLIGLLVWAQHGFEKL